MDPWWSVSWSVVREELWGIPDVAEITRISVRLAMAVIVGGLVGYEREASGHAAGLRTHMLVSLGSAIFILVPLQAGMELADLSRVMQGVVAGIGFLGAGTIIKMQDKEIRGLTTAASIWLTAAIGVACGLGHGLTALLCALLALIVLAVVKWSVR